MNFNRVILIGRLTRDPEFTKTKGDIECAKFGFAVSNGFGDKKKAVFVDMTAWGKTAVFINNYFKKGNEILIEGRLDFESWESKEGEKRSKLCVVAEKVDFVGAKQNPVEEAKEAIAKGATDDEIPF